MSASVPAPRALEPADRRWLAVAARHGVVFRRLWRAGLFSRLGGPLLTLFAIGWGVGALVDAGGRGGIPWQGVTLPYAVFVAPAIVVSTAMMTGFGEGSWPVLGAIKWQGTFHAMLATPLRVRDIVAGHIAQLAWQLTGGALLLVVLAVPFGLWGSWWVLGVVVVATLTGLAFGLLMTTVAARFLSEAWFTLAYRVVLTPLMLFSGTYFPVEQLPTGLQPLAWVTPLWHGVEAARGLATGVAHPGRLAVHLLVLVGFVAVGRWLAARALQRALVT